MRGGRVGEGALDIGNPRGSRRACGRCTRIAAQVAGRIRRPHSIGVRGRGTQARIAIAGGGESGDLGKARAARPLAPLHAVAAHPDVVGRGAPAEIDLVTGSRRGRQAARRGGRLRVPSAAPWGLEGRQLQDPRTGVVLGGRRIVGSGGTDDLILHGVCIVCVEPLRKPGSGGDDGVLDIIGRDQELTGVIRGHRSAVERDSRSRSTGRNIEGIARVEPAVLQDADVSIRDRPIEGHRDGIRRRRSNILCIVEDLRARSGNDEHAGGGGIRIACGVRDRLHRVCRVGPSNADDVEVA